MTIQEEQRTLSIVVLGAFNPAIFHPAWLSAEGLLPHGEAEAAEVEVVHREVSIFRADWVRVEVTSDRLAFRTERESHFEPLRDLAVGSLSLLRHTPTRICGVNHDTTVKFSSREDFDNFGWHLVPEENWSPVLQRPGMVRVDEQGERSDEFDGYIRIRIEPALDLTNRALFAVNDHFIFSPKENSPELTERICSLLTDEWTAIGSRADSILEHLKVLAK